MLQLRQDKAILSGASRIFQETEKGNVYCNQQQQQHIQIQPAERLYTEDEPVWVCDVFCWAK
ncbi:MAG: hypothetical protein WC615_01995 [Mucilaginibacter sp.]|jgi:hypothetical protein|uniref:hypothetical protein n=1 Tax=Mucilaginibacter sp. TaxID=1882438 RepID=UPI00356202EF